LVVIHMKLLHTAIYISSETLNLARSAAAPLP